MDTHDGLANSVDEPARFERVANALNFHVGMSGYESVAAALKTVDGLSIDLAGH